MAGEATHPAGRGQEPAGFTLVELLVVIAIITLLLMVLMPSLNRAKELARRAVCASNLHALGLVAMQFATEHDGVFPGCYRREQWWRPAYPHCIRLNGPRAGAAAGYPFTTRIWNSSYTVTEFQETPTDTVDGPVWQHYGTSLDTWQEFDLNAEGLRCPSAANDLKYENSPEGFGRLATTYAYIGTLYHVPGRGNGDGDRYAWDEPGSPVPYPAVSQEDADVARRVLACDLITTSSWNHPNESDPELPGWQAVLWGDGHLKPHPEGYYDEPLDDVGVSYTAFQSPNYYWW
jgi:prepilin-type N-terminal cleavage/methylation domain-containing protein